MFIPRTLLLALGIAGIILSSLDCANAPAAPANGDRAALLGGRTWITESITFNGIDVTSEGVRALTLESNGSYVSVINGGGSLSGTWALSEDGSQLVLDEGAMEESVFDLDEVTSTLLRMSWTGERDEVTGRYEYTGRSE
jgi:hypothetical protein